jgi:hypothetical protein
MHRCSLIGPAVLLLLAATPAAKGADEAAAQGKTPAGITVWDTRRPSTEALAPASLAGTNDWTVIPPGKTADHFQGDAVLSNGRIIAVLRKHDSAVIVHALKPDGAVARFGLRLHTTRDEPAQRLERVTLLANNRTSACVEATFRTANGTEVTGRFRVQRGDVAVRVEPGTGAGKLRVECPGRFVVLPDFFADDITLDATRLPLSAAELPSENFVLHLTGQGDSLAMCVFENRQQDVRVTLDGAGERRQITGSEIGFEGKKIWVALLDAPGIWHAHDLNAADTNKVIRLDWKMPFPAQWRVDFSRPEDLTDSWEMLLQEQKGAAYTKPSWLGGGDQSVDANRHRWNTVLGSYPYPCWSDPDGQGYLQPLRGKVIQFQGPALVYPINRVKQTPLDAFTVVDVMRNTLGAGPCEYLLDLEGQKSEYRGRATCSVRDTLIPIYVKNEQKEKRAKVDRTLDEGLTFVKHIRGRITRYVEFGQRMRAYLAEQKKVHPELAGVIAELDQLTQEIDKRVAARSAKIKTPDDVARMNEDFRKNVLAYEGPDALERCQNYARALVEIGDNQDELSGECRWVVKTLRQRAGLRLALDPRLAPIAAEIRARTQEALRNPASHEGARH